MLNLRLMVTRIKKWSSLQRLTRRLLTSITTSSTSVDPPSFNTFTSKATVRPEIHTVIRGYRDVAQATAPFLVTSMWTAWLFICPPLNLQCLEVHTTSLSCEWTVHAQRQVKHCT